MRILYVYKSMFLLAGMERILTDKMNYLAEQLGYDVYLLTYEQGTNPLAYPLSSRIKYRDLNVMLCSKCRYSYPKRLWVYKEMRADFKKKFYEAVRDIHPDIIISTTISFQILDIILKTPGNYVHVLETHVAKEEGVMKSAEFRKFSLFKIAAYFYDRYMIHHIKKAHVMVALTEQDKKKWEHVVHTIVIPNLLTYFPASVSTLTEKCIISVGRCEMQKGYDLLIQAWSSAHSKHPDWQMHVYGNGSLRNSLQAMIDKYSLTSSFILNPATPDIYNRYLEHSFFVLSSRYEGFGLVLIEAMSCGLPCVSFDCPSGPSDVINDGEDGILVENGNIEKLSEAICRLIENEQERKQMGIKARENVKRYSKESIMRRWDVLFKSLVFGIDLK